MLQRVVRAFPRASYERSCGLPAPAFGAWLTAVAPASRPTGGAWGYERRPRLGERRRFDGRPRSADRRSRSGPSKTALAPAVDESEQRSKRDARRGGCSFDKRASPLAPGSRLLGTTSERDSLASARWSQCATSNRAGDRRRPPRSNGGRAAAGARRGDRWARARLTWGREGRSLGSWPSLRRRLEC